ncbi:MAG: glycogen-binding domain-containing protein [bacterium]
MNKRSLQILLVLDIICIIGVTMYMVQDVNDKSPFQILKTRVELPVSIPTPAQKTMTNPIEKESPLVQVQDKTTRKIRFEYRNSKPRQVSVLGEFSDWEPIPMEKGENHTWSAVVEITPGDYLYCYDIDGRLLPDPNNRNLRILSGDEKRSLLTVKPLP